MPRTFTEEKTVYKFTELSEDAKEQHVMETWQDKPLARSWQRIANRLIHAANEAKEEKI